MSFSETTKNCSIPITNIASSRNDLISNFPSININRELFHSYSSVINENLVLPVENESLIKLFTRKFYEEGLINAIKATNSLNPELYPISNFITKYLIQILDIGKKIQSSFCPKLFSFEFTDESRESGGPIRCIQWHPNYFKLAISASDDSIRVYTQTSSIIPVLKSGLQKSVSCISWRPFISADLAVGCENGVLIWSLDPNSHITRPITQAIHLKLDNHMSITCIDWSPNGSFLATASKSNSDVLIWDVDKNVSVALKRVGSPCALLSWSLDGLKLCSSTFGNVIRVWNTEKWTADKWTLENGATKSVAWSSCGVYLLFVTTKDSYLYSISFVDEQFFTTSNNQRATPLVDLSKLAIQHTDIPLDLSWCPRNNYLAVTFKNNSAIAIFTTVISRNMLNVTPSCFLTGSGVEYPLAMSFIKHNIKQSILTIGWSSGKVQYFPFD